MRRKPWSTWGGIVALIAAIALFGDGCKKDDSTTGPGGGGGVTNLTFTTPNQTLNVSTTGGATRARLTGGTLPYTITAAPTPSVATASFSQDTLTIVPVGAGTTSITVQDANPIDNPPRSVTIGITVTGSGGGGGVQGNGTLSFSSTVGNFSASGSYDPNATTGQGAGGVRTSSGSVQVLTLNAFSYASPTDLSIVIVTFYAEAGLTATSYPIPTTGTVVYGAHINPADTSSYRARTYSLYNGTKAISALSATNATGSFSGTGMNTLAQQMTLSNGAFNINYVTSADAPPSGKLQKIIETLLERSKQ